MWRTGRVAVIEETLGVPPGHEIRHFERAAFEIAKILNNTIAQNSVCSIDVAADPRVARIVDRALSYYLPRIDCAFPLSTTRSEGGRIGRGRFRMNRTRRIQPLASTGSRRAVSRRASGGGSQHRPLRDGRYLSINIGHTLTNVATVAVADGAVSLVSSTRFPTPKEGRADDAARRIADVVREQIGPGRQPVVAAAIAIAETVHDGIVYPNDKAGLISRDGSRRVVEELVGRIRQDAGTDQIHLLNDADAELIGVAFGRPAAKAGKGRLSADGVLSIRFGTWAAIAHFDGQVQTWPGCRAWPWICLRSEFRHRDHRPRLVGEVLSFLGIGRIAAQLSDAADEPPTPRELRRSLDDSAGLRPTAIKTYEVLGGAISELVDEVRAYRRVERVILIGSESNGLDGASFDHIARGFERTRAGNDGHGGRPRLEIVLGASENAGVMGASIFAAATVLSA
jgi:hypothetical protein